MYLCVRGRTSLYDNRKRSTPQNNSSVIYRQGLITRLILTLPTYRVIKPDFLLLITLLFAPYFNNTFRCYCTRKNNNGGSNTIIRSPIFFSFPLPRLILLQLVARIRWPSNFILSKYHAIAIFEHLDAVPETQAVELYRA